jgi:putative endonuclease
VQYSVNSAHSYYVIGTFADWIRHLVRQRRWNPDLALGRRGEDLAHRYLRRLGYTIVARNYRLASGEAEADLIAWDRDTLVVVEVKTRRSDQFGPPDRAVGEDKIAHLRRVARAYARKTDTPWGRVRVDIVTVVLDSPPQLQLLRNALII